MKIERFSPGDLEVGGELAGLPASSTRYVRYEDLLRLPQETYTVSDDSNFAVRLASAIPCPAAGFNSAKRLAVMALTLSMLMWLIALLTVGAEWFLMWQSHTWNGREAAFRMFAVVGLVLLTLMQPDAEGQP